MQHLFAAHLPNDGRRFEVEDCRVTRIRYRPRHRCVLQYTVNVRDHSAGCAVRRWVTGTMYAEPGRAERLWREVAAGNAVAEQASLFIRELDMAVNVFPFDRRLPQADLLLNGRDAQLEAEMLRRFGGGAWSIVASKAEPVRYREHLALVVRYVVDAVDQRSNATARKVFFVKAYPDAEQPRRMFRQVRRLAEYARRSLPQVRIDAPVAYLQQLNAVLLESTPGQPLDKLMQTAEPTELLAAIRQTAGALARFNLSDAPTDRRYTVQDHLSDVARAEKLLACASPPLRDRVSAVMQAVVASATDSEPHAWPTHRDMKPEHVLWSETAVGLIDLDSSANADPVMDAGLMLARLAALRFDSHRPWLIDAAAAAFTSEYFHRVPGEWRARLPSQYAAALIEVAAGIFHRQEEEWIERVAILVQEAHSAARGRSATMFALD